MRHSHPPFAPAALRAAAPPLWRLAVVVLALASVWFCGHWLLMHGLRQVGRNGWSSVVPAFTLTGLAAACSGTALKRADDRLLAVLVRARALQRLGAVAALASAGALLVCLHCIGGVSATGRSAAQSALAFLAWVAAGPMGLLALVLVIRGSLAALRHRRREASRPPTVISEVATVRARSAALIDALAGQHMKSF